MFGWILTTAGAATAATIYATSVADYDGYFMNWDATNGFYHNPTTEYPDAGANLGWLLGAEDQAVAAGWGGDANGGTLTLFYEIPFTADGTSAADIIVYGFGFAYNTPFSPEKGAITVYASTDGDNWTAISDYAGYSNGSAWEANPDFTESAPGVPSVIMEIDLDDDISSAYDGLISYLKFELGRWRNRPRSGIFYQCGRRRQRRAGAGGRVAAGVGSARIDRRQENEPLKLYSWTHHLLFTLKGERKNENEKSNQCSRRPHVSGRHGHGRYGVWGAGL